MYVLTSFAISPRFNLAVAAIILYMYIFSRRRNQRCGFAIAEERYRYTQFHKFYFYFVQKLFAVLYRLINATERHNQR